MRSSDTQTEENEFRHANWRQWVQIRKLKTMRSSDTQTEDNEEFRHANWRQWVLTCKLKAMRSSDTQTEDNISRLMNRCRFSIEKSDYTRPTPTHSYRCRNAQCILQSGRRVRGDFNKEFRHANWREWVLTRKLKRMRSSDTQTEDNEEFRHANWRQWVQTRKLKRMRSSDTQTEDNEEFRHANWRHFPTNEPVRKLNWEERLHSTT